MRIHAYAAASLAVAVSLTAGCSNVLVSRARLYNIDNDMVSTARFYALDEHYGRIRLRLPDGEQLRGEFTLTAEHAQGGSVPEKVRLSLTGRMRRTGGVSLAQVFGYKPTDKAGPVAVATAVGARGTTVEIVFYTLDVEAGRGQGVAHDNQGNWYLVRLGI